jgi:hypothetical protein
MPNRLLCRLVWKIIYFHLLLLYAMLVLKFLNCVLLLLLLMMRLLVVELNPCSSTGPAFQSVLPALPLLRCCCCIILL